MEQILVQIERALYLLRLAKPANGLWDGVAATSLASSLASLETELVSLQQSLNW